MATKRKTGRAIDKLPQKPVTELGHAGSLKELSEATAELYGFDVEQTGRLLREKRLELLGQLKAPKGVGDKRSQSLEGKVSVLKELEHTARVALDFSAPQSLAHARWSRAINDGLKALDDFQQSWVAPARVRIAEISDAAKGSTPGRWPHEMEKSINILLTIRLFEQLKTAIEGIRQDPEKRGLKLARWQALLNSSGFTWPEVAGLFVYCSQESSPEAARKRVARLHEDPHEAEQTLLQWEGLRDRGADI